MGDHEMTDEELLALAERVSNRGRWGHDDELGTLNYITPEKRRTAAALVRSGETLSIARDLSATPDPATGEAVDHRMLFAGPGPTYASDYVGIAPHGFTMTHLDAVCHSTWNGRLYNGRHVEDVQYHDGLAFGSIHAMRDGIFTRGVLLDVARALDVEYLEPDHLIGVEDLHAAEELCGVHVESGDALLVRTGLRRWEAEHGPLSADTRAGLGARCVEWMHEREVAVYGGDCVELIPYPSDMIQMPLHHIAMPSMGLILLDWPEVEELAVTCRHYDRWEFLLTVAPIRLPRATGAAVNPICVF
ncbi:cyclase family protein [Spirillospora sp. NPDC048911]|uniref:cyclase family protein n=1 Tax=Spirillospora sp. NPDC048911 TaxID=3364527 RepID=UPI0037145B15